MRVLGGGGEGVGLVFCEVKLDLVRRNDLVGPVQLISLVRDVGAYRGLVAQHIRVRRLRYTRLHHQAGHRGRAVGDVLGSQPAGMAAHYGGLRGWSCDVLFGLASFFNITFSLTSGLEAAGVPSLALHSLDVAAEDDDDEQHDEHEQDHDREQEPRHVCRFLFLRHWALSDSLVAALAELGVLRDQFLSDAFQLDFELLGP